MNIINAFRVLIIMYMARFYMLDTASFYSILLNS